MAKRFIDTELFEDSWFMDLSKDAKLFWIYLITRCDHAGIIDLNIKLAEFQTGIKSMKRLIEDLSNRLIYLRDSYFFIPKFIEFQYPGFPRSNVRQQMGAIKRLNEFSLWDTENETLNKDLLKSYGNVIGNGNGNVIGNGIDKNNYYILYDKLKKELNIKDESDDHFLLWLKYKSEKGQTYKESGIKALLKKWKDKPINELKDAVEHSMISNYDGLFSPNKKQKKEPYRNDTEAEYENSKGVE